MSKELRRELIPIDVKFRGNADHIGSLEIVERDDGYWHLRILTELSTVDVLLRTPEIDRLAKLLTWRAPR